MRITILARAGRRGPAAGAAKQPPYRLPERLALDVPERHVDRRERLRAEPGLPARGQGPIKLVPDQLVRQRIVALDRWRDDPVDDLGDDRLAGDRAQTMADDAGIGLDLDEAAFERRIALDAGKLDVQRDVEGRRGDARDFHVTNGTARSCAKLSLRTPQRFALQSRGSPRAEQRDDRRKISG